MRHDGLDAADSLVRKNRPKFFLGSFREKFCRRQILWEPISGKDALIEIEVAQRLALGRVFGFAQRLGELLLKQIFLVAFRIHRLAED